MAHNLNILHFPEDTNACKTKLICKRNVSFEKELQTSNSFQCPFLPKKIFMSLRGVDDIMLHQTMATMLMFRHAY